MTRKRYAVDTVRDEPVRLRDQLDHIAAEGGRVVTVIWQPARQVALEPGLPPYEVSCGRSDPVRPSPMPSLSRSVLIAAGATSAKQSFLGTLWISSSKQSVSISILSQTIHREMPGVKMSSRSARATSPLRLIADSSSSRPSGSRQAALAASHRL
jgi:hypothetical protein